MSNIVKIRNLILGEGLPKICVPVMGKDQREIVYSARSAMEQEPDMIEWRVDFLQRIEDTEALCDVLKELRGCLGDTPLLATFRTKREGGEQELSYDAYIHMYRAILESGMADAIDLELYFDSAAVSALIDAAHACGKKVILSNHDFQKTPPKNELVRRLEKMQELGGDIAKVAVMPQNNMDVLKLLEATDEAHRKLQGPVVTMSMGAIGAVSRLLGETFGSALTFGMAGQASAPGQIPVEDLRSILQKLHCYSTR